MNSERSQGQIESLEYVLSLCHCEICKRSRQFIKIRLQKLKQHEIQRDNTRQG